MKKQVTSRNRFMQYFQWTECPQYINGVFIFSINTCVKKRILNESIDKNVLDELTKNELPGEILNIPKKT